MPITFDCEDEPNDFMEMPCLCDCGKWFDLNDGYASRNLDITICKECHEKEEKNQQEDLDADEAIDRLQNAKCELTDCFELFQKEFHEEAKEDILECKVALLRQCQELMLNFGDLIPKPQNK